MNAKESKRSKARRKLYSGQTSAQVAGPLNDVWPSMSNCNMTAFSNAITAFQTFGNGVTMNENDVALTMKNSHSDAERITELMDAPVDLDLDGHPISRGPNPFLDRCVHCSSLRLDSQEGDEGFEYLDLQLDGNAMISTLENSQPFSSFKLKIWTCPKCRKDAQNFQSSFLAYDLPYVNDKEDTPHLPFTKLEEERETMEREDVQDNWVELRSIVRDLYVCIDEAVLEPEQEKRLQYLMDRLCHIDPHQLFLGLEAQVREIVTEVKANLVTKLKEDGCDRPELALEFARSLLSHYDLLTNRAHLLAQYLGGLSSHLKRFEVTWELLNKHLFHSIAHNDPTISSCEDEISKQLRQGSKLYEKSQDDPYCSVLKRLYKYQDEMSVVVVVWRDCQQLIENYCHEEVKNTHKHVSSKTRSFISQQRQLLKDHLLKEPFSGEALTETMRNLMATHQSSMERVMCRRCKRERCTCDECTITHRITCGIINSDFVGDHTPNAFNFALDHTRNVMDITPPSMSSTTSSSGSVSPITIDDKLTTFYDHRDEFSDALLNCEDREGKAMSLNADSNFENGEDDEADDEDEGDTDEYGDVQNAGSDEPHALQDPAFFLEAVQDQREQLRQQHLYIERLNHHNCSHQHVGKNGGMCPFQPPITQKLSRELDAEIAKSGIAPKGIEGFATNDILGLTEDSADSKNASSGSNKNPALCAACQCHVCLNQSGHIVSTSLPQQVAASPSPADLHLYPHIHGLPQQDPKNFMLPHLMSSKLPVKIDFDDTTGLHELCSDWERKMQPRPGSLAAQHQHQHNHRLSSHSSNLIPPNLESVATPFTFDFASHLATHTTHTSTTNTTSAFKSLSGKHFASSIMPTLSNVGNITSEGSSVDPTRPLDFSSLVKIPQSCLNGIGSFPASPFAPSTLSVSSPATLSSVPPVTSSTAASRVNGTCQGPPCTRPTPVGGNASTSKWEKGHLQHCKKFTGGGHPHKQQPSNTGLHHTPHNGSPGPHAANTQPFSSSALKNLFPNHHQQKEDTKSKSVSACSIAASSVLRPGGLTSQPEEGVVRPPSSNGSPTASQGPACNNPSLNNIGVGTSPCNDPECEVHHGEDNCDSVDDSCSEKSSSTTTSNQKEGKYCDCCYCEFFGHNNGTAAKTSTNYIATKDRLRKKLKNRQNEGKNGIKKEMCNDNIHDPLEKKGLDGLLKFINGTDDVSECKTKAKEISAKAAKRARQKQKKMEEKAKFKEAVYVDSIQFLKTKQPASMDSEINIVMSRCTKQTNSPKKEAQLDTPQVSSATSSSLTTNLDSHVSLHDIGSPCKGSSLSKSSKENLKPNSASSQQQGDKQSQHQCSNDQPVEQSPQVSSRNVKGQQIQKQQGHQKQQMPMSRAVNDSSTNELSSSKTTSSSSSNHSTPNGKSFTHHKSSNGVSNGQLVGNLCDTKSKPNSATTAAPPPTVPGPAVKTVVIDSPGPGAGSGSSASQSPSCGTKNSDQGKANVKSKKKKKNKNGGIGCLDEIFMPKSESELDGDVDDFERELEEFKRFCFEPAEPKERRKIAVNVNLKDIFKKKTGLV